MTTSAPTNFPIIGVTAATGQLGQLIVADLLQRGVPAGNIVAIVRNPVKAANMAAQGVQVREANYKSKEGWDKALAGVERLMMISSGELDDRVQQHRNVIEAAKAAGVKLLAYTSFVNADKVSLPLAADHQATEKVLATAGIPYVLLRDGWYTETYDTALGNALKSGVILGAAGEGRVSAAPRAEFAEADAAVLLGEGHEGKIYELGGDQSFSMSELAAELSRQTGKEIVYRNQSAAEYQKTLEGLGIPAGFAHLLATSDEGVGRGELETNSGDLGRLIGRPTTPLSQYIADFLNKQA